MHAAPVNTLTVDLEEWFQGLTSTNRQPARWPELESRVVGATQRLLRLLAEHGVRATFFVLGHVADHHPALIEEVAAAGHELGIHGYAHRFVSRMTRAEFDDEVTRSIEALTLITDEMPAGHRAPYFSINASTPWAFECLAAQGLRYDASVFPTRSLLYGYPDAPRLPYQIPGHALWEVPASTLRIGGRNWPVAGGFYFRALPYAVTRWALRRLQQAGEPAVMYLHPWELDTGQRYAAVTMRERVTHYAGRRGLANKLHRLFRDFNFAPMGDLVASLDATKTSPATPQRVEA